MGPEADGYGDGTHQHHAHDHLEDAAEDMPDEYRPTVDRHRAEAGHDALGHVHRDGHRAADHRAADGHHQDARDDIDDVSGAVGGAGDARAHGVAEDVDEEQQQDDRRQQQVEGQGRVAPGVQEVAAQHRGRGAHGESEGAHRAFSFGWSNEGMAPPL
jgi:hypothetical protein